MHRGSSISKRFNHAAETYSQSCAVQSTACEELLALMRPHVGAVNHAADFGCGTGINTQKLLESFDITQCTAVDFAEDLLSEASVRLPSHVTVTLANYNERLFEKSALELAFANMSFQWSLDFSKTLRVMHDQLCDQGILAFSIPLDGTFDALKPSHRNTFFSPQIIEAVLQSSRFVIKASQTLNITQQFSSPLEALRSIKKIGATTLMNECVKPSGLLTKNKLKDCFVECENIQLAYRIGLFVAEKKES